MQSESSIFVILKITVLINDYEIPLTNKIQLLGIPLDIISSEQIKKLLADAIDSDRKTTVCNINVHAVNIADKNQEFVDTLKSSDLVICDSDIIRILARLFYRVQVQKLTGSRWFIDFISDYQKPVRVFLLGDREEILDGSKSFILGLNRHAVIETHNGFFEKSETSHVLNKINRFKPNIILIGMGMPKQEIFIRTHYNQLPNAVMIPVGGAFKYWAGVYTQAPKWMLILSLEWLHRIYQEPIRLGKRYMKDGIIFTYILVKKLFS